MDTNLTVSVMWHRDGSAPKFRERFLTREEAEAYIRAHAIDENGNLSTDPSGVGGYLYIDDGSGDE